MEEMQEQEIPQPESNSNNSSPINTEPIKRQGKRKLAIYVLAILAIAIVGLVIFAETGTKPIKVQQSNISIDPNFAKIANMQNWSANPYIYASFLLPFSKTNFTFAEFESLNVTKFAGNLSFLKGLNASWNSVDPRIRCLVLTTLQTAYNVLNENASSIPLINKTINASNYGKESPCLNSGFANSLSKYYLVPKNVTNKVSLYELDFTSGLIITDIKLMSPFLNNLNCQPKQLETSTSLLGYLAYYPPFKNSTLISSLPEYRNEPPTFSFNSSYSDIFFSLQLQYMLILQEARTKAAIELLKGGNETCGNLSFDGKDLLPAISFYQYAALQNHEVVYNMPPPPPTITFAMYFNKTLVLNLGDVNPAASDIRLYIDNKEANYTRYYSFLVATNLTLYPGNHTIAVYGSGLNVSKNLYFDPPLDLNFSYFSTNTSTLYFINVGIKPIQLYKIELHSKGFNFTIGTDNETILPNQTLAYALQPICTYSNIYGSSIAFIKVFTSEGPVMIYLPIRCV